MFNGWWVTDLLAQPNGQMLLAAHVIWVITAITLHELAHGWVALAKGDRTGLELGHITWNPIVHMGPFSLVLFAICGMAFGAMPVDETRLRGRYAPVLVTLAGPGMNLLLFVVCALASVLLIAGGASTSILSASSTLDKALVFTFTGAWLNMALAIFNMLPVPPLDGGRVMAFFVPAVRRAFEGPNAVVYTLTGLAIVFIVAGPFVADWATSLTRLVILGLVP